MRRARTRGLAAVIVLAIVATGCSSSGGDGEAGPSSTTQPTPEAPTTTGPLGSGTSPIPPGIHIEVLSSQPDRVSGDDARVRITPAAGGSTAALQVLVDDRNVTGSLVERDGSLEGVITGLIEGNNTIVARADGEEVIQRLRAWPVSGPIISGPHGPPLACTTAELGLGEPTDDDCSAPPRISWKYVRTDGTVGDLPSPTTRPTDLATAKIDGQEVPMAIRIERGVINRAVYELAWVDTTPGDEASDDGWNQKLVFQFDGTCGATFGQGRALAGSVDADLLRQGYAVASSTLTDASTQCNDVLAAETAMMVKEQAIEALGKPRFTIGEGTKGGAALLHLIAQNYPGVVNGIVASQPLPDHITALSTTHDCLLLDHYFATQGKALSAAQRRAITGGASDRTCAGWTDAMGDALDPDAGCDPKATAPAIRCTYQDANLNQLGTDPATGAPNRPLDNVGLQYGLQALNEGTISFDEFLDLNRSIGGLDDDGMPIPDRTEAAADGVARAFETGRVSFGGGDQLTIPIIDIDVFDDDDGTPFDRLRAFALRERLTKGAGAEEAPGFQIWTRDAADPRATGATTEAVAVLDDWLTALADHDGGGSMDQALLVTRPDDAVDNCLVIGEPEPRRGLDVYEDDEDEPGTCAEAFPVAEDPRVVAGGPIAGHVLKCDVKAPDPNDYAERPTPEQFSQLQQVFSQGVCDWFVPSVGQTTPATPDRSYEDVTSPLQNA